jgi:hypothetical protein
VQAGWLQRAIQRVGAGAIYAMYFNVHVPLIDGIEMRGAVEC